MQPLDFLRQLDDGALWLAAVVAGLTALGWLLRKSWRGYRKLTDFMLKADVALDLVSYEMQHNGGGSIKDAASKLPGIAKDVADLKEGAKVLRDGAVDIARGAADTTLKMAEMRQALTDHIQQVADIRTEEVGEFVHLADDKKIREDLAESLPIVARSTPHERDIAQPDDDVVGP